MGNKTYQTEYLSSCQEDLARAAMLLQQGHVVGIPTETVYGLAANAYDEEAIRAIFEAKGRPQDNPLIVHIGEAEQLKDLVCEIPPVAEKLASAYWPGPLTMIFKRSDRIPAIVSGGLNTVAVRFPVHPIARKIINLSGLPLAAPSANLSGSPSPTTMQHVQNDMDGRVAAIVDGGPCSVGVESTVISVVDGSVQLLRPGGITVDMLEAVAGPIQINDAVTHKLKDGAVAASPGMKYKHYAPKAKVILLDGTAAQVRAYINAHAETGVWALCFSGEEEGLQVPYMLYGAREDASEQAKHVFDALRKADEVGASVLYTSCPSQEGVGLAVYNRLLRAAAFEVISLKAKKRTVIGLTGPTGSGKSELCLLWESLGAHVVDTDKISREVTGPNSPCLQELVKEFSPEILKNDGRLNRHKLAQIAFISPEKTKRLTAITHPYILAKCREEIEAHVNAGEVVLVDAPLLFESGLDADCTATVAVLANEDVRCKRIMMRDNISCEDAMHRIHAQHPESYYRTHARYSLENNGSVNTFKTNAKELWLCLVDQVK